MCRETTCFCIIFSSLQLGGGIEIKSRRGGFSSDESWAGYGNAEAGYGSNASSWNAAVFAGFHNHENWLDFAASLDRGDDYEFDGGVVAATEYDREQYRFGYGQRWRRKQCCRTGQTLRARTPQNDCRRVGTGGG
jgi:hypothetical protein